jgi:hypothetical protein
MMTTESITTEQERDGADDGTPGIAERCRAAGGLTQTTLGELREELGYKKLGTGVLAEIEEHIIAAGLGFFPIWKLRHVTNTDPRKEQRLWVYDLDGSARTAVIEAIVDPENCPDVLGTLAGLVSGDHAALTPHQKLDLIREIAAR